MTNVRQERDPLAWTPEDDSLAADYFNPYALESRRLQYEACAPQINLEDLDYAPTDVEARVLHALRLSGNETILDIGGGQGDTSRFIRVGLGHLGNVVNIEPNDVRLTYGDEALEVIPPDLLHRYLKNAKLLDTEPVDLSDLDLSERLVEYEPIKSKYGTATETGMPDNSAQLVILNRVAQHLTELERLKAYAEFRRVLSDGGLSLIIATGRRNKQETRWFEGEIATWLSLQTRRRLQAGEITSGVRTEAPPNMNEGFTTEKAEDELPRHFEHVYRFKLDYKMSIEKVGDEFEIACLINALRSRRNKFNPIPSWKEYNAAIETVVVPIICANLLKGKSFEDLAEHSAFICTNRELKVVPPGFKKLERQS